MPDPLSPAMLDELERLNSVQAGPAVMPDPAEGSRRARAQLRQAVWEATQFMSYEQIRAYVDSVLVEVESDLP